jgi:glycosyltransferase involved in cell wall biosynthesis
MKISVVIPTYNEEANIERMCSAVEDVFVNELTGYDYELLIIDNDSEDGTRDIITNLCLKDKKIKAIFNARNFGPINSPFYALCQTEGDAAILINADFQEPVDMIEKFVHEWETGKYEIVCGVRKSCRENKIVSSIRKLYYKFMSSMSEFDQIKGFNGFGLYDKKVLQRLKEQNDPIPFIRSMVSEFGFLRKEIYYSQERRMGGKSSFNFYRYYDVAMIGITAYTKIGMRLAVFFGAGCALLSFISGMIYLVWKIMYWDSFTPGIAPIVIGLFFLGSVQLIFLGILGEYVLSLKTRIMNRPLVIERKRINF